MKRRYTIMTTLLCTAFLAGCQKTVNGGSAIDCNEKPWSSMLEENVEFPEAILVKSSEDTAAQELEKLMKNFGQAYFNGDIETIAKFLVNNYEWDIETYEFTGRADIVRINGLQQINKQQLLDHYELSMQFRFPGEDSQTYLTVTWEKEGNDWKVSGYGLEK